MVRAWRVVAGAVLVIGLGSVLQDPVDEDTAPFPRKGRYLGKPGCVECHRSEARAIARGVHAAVVSSEVLDACETCHGPGYEHGVDPDNEPEKITYPPALSAASQSKLCGRCHAPQVRGHGGDVQGFIESGRGCTECHSVHESRSAPEHSGVRFRTRTACDASADPVGGKRCAQCHPRLDARLQQSGHAHLASDREAGCESCHGEGSLHVETNGFARLITRPDAADDGVATCVGCHADVDATRFHWEEGAAPLLSEGLRCTSCHEVHAPRDHPVGGVPMAATNRMCAECHAPAFEVLRGTVHTSLGGLDTPLARGCGSCHDGAENHARHGGARELVESLRDSSAATQLAACGSCHQSDTVLRHVRNGSHHRHEVSCLACHSPAEAAGATRDAASARCASCHQAVAAEFRLPNRHPIAGGLRPGGVLCVDCHEPHGARPRIRDLDLKERRCVSCHEEYRGPFVFAHQASRSDGCVACHTPHGSSNRRMLHAATTQQSCLPCHADFPAFHDQTIGAAFTNCVRCHTEVHGSNHSRFLFR